jgi:CRP-like cAMP-binding protein
MDNKIIFKERELIFKEGEKALKLFVIISGEVLCLKSSKDRLIPVYLAKSGDIIGENAMIEDSVYQSSAISLSRVEVIEMPSFNFKRVFKEVPKWLSDLSLTMVNRFQETANLIAENRVISSRILTEDQFTPKFENELKKIINQ